MPGIRNAFGGFFAPSSGVIALYQVIGGRLKLGSCVQLVTIDSANTGSNGDPASTDEFFALKNDIVAMDVTDAAKIPNLQYYGQAVWE
jgi:hypothetical protein